MTAGEIRSIIAKHEMQRIELKESFDAECIETACAFANAHGGCIFIGVTDRGEPSKSRLRRESLRDYENKISTATEPSVAVDAEKTEFRGREIVVLRVMENPLKPVAFKGRCFIRKGSVNHQMTPAEIAECHLKSTGGSMDAVIMPNVTKDDLSEDAIRRYRIIAQAFFDMHIIEQYGSGIQRIKDACRTNGNDFPTWVNEGGMFSTTYRVRHRKDIKPYGPTTEETAEKTTEKTTEKILRLLGVNGKLTIRELAMACNLSDDGVRWQVRKLKAAGVIRRIGPDKGGHWEIVEQSSSNGGSDISCN